MMLWFLLKSSLLIFLFLLKSLFDSFSFELFWWPLMQNFTNQASICVYAMTTLWHNRWYQDMHHDGMVCMLWKVWSLMCTSHVADNTQGLVSMGKWRKSKAMWLSMRLQKSMMISRYQVDIQGEGDTQSNVDVAVRSSPWCRWVVVMLMLNRT